MKIVFDARVISHKTHGMARYAYNLIVTLARLDNGNEYVLISGNEDLRGFCANYKNFKFLKCLTPLYSIQEQVQIPLILSRERPDIYHSPTFSTPFFSPCKTIITIHDLIHLVYGNYFHKLYYRFVGSKVKKNPYWIFSVSKFSKADITQSLGIPPEKVFVTYIGVESKFKPTINENSAKEKYILFVGNDKPHKNLEGVLKVYNLASKKIDFTHSLKVVGVEKNFVAHRIKRDGLDPRISKKIHTYQNYTDDELIRIYQSADLFLGPSLCEGFGLPMLEAMACGVPVITSSRTSIPEVVGDAAIMVDPEKEQIIADTICEVLSNNDLRNTMINRGLERAKMFSWEKTAQETLDLYRMINENN